MGLRRSWLRGLLGAGGAAVIVPVGLLVAVALAATVGGGGPAGFGQILGGPTLPKGVAAQTASGTREPAEARDDVPAVPLRARSSTGSDARPVATPTAPADRDAAPGRPRPARPAPSPSPSPAPARPAPTPTPSPSAPAPTPTPAPPAPAPTAPRDPVTGLVRDLGDVVDGVVRPVPAVGPPLADAVGTVVDLLAPPDRSAPAPTDPVPAVPGTP